MMWSASAYFSVDQFFRKEVTVGSTMNELTGCSWTEPRCWLCLPRVHLQGWFQLPLGWLISSRLLIRVLLIPQKGFCLLALNWRTHHVSLFSPPLIENLSPVILILQIYIPFLLYILYYFFKYVNYLFDNLKKNRNSQNTIGVTKCLKWKWKWKCI